MAMGIQEQEADGTPQADKRLSLDGRMASSIPDSEVLDHLGRRFSVSPKYLTFPAPTEAELLQAAYIALRAPDHEGLHPFRFVQIGLSQRERLATLFAQGAARRGQGADDLERARQRAHNGPALLALIGRVRPDVENVPAHEQWLCIGAGLMNFLNALHLMGYGAKTMSGASIQDAEVQQAFCKEGERLLAWIVVGTPVRATHARQADDVTGVMTNWRE